MGLIKSNLLYAVNVCPLKKLCANYVQIDKKMVIT